MAPSTQWVALAHGCPPKVHSCSASKGLIQRMANAGGVATELGSKATQSTGGCSLRLEDLLPGAGSSSATPSTSAASSPRARPQLGVPASTEMASADCSPLSGAAMAPPPGLAAPPQLALPMAWEMGFAPSAEEELLPLAPPGLFVSRPTELLPPGVCLPPLRPPPGLVHPAAIFAPAPAAAAVAAAEGSSRNVEWHIHHVLTKLKTSAGFALVSPPLQVGGIADVRLHFAPGTAWANSMRCRKGKRAEVKSQDGMVNGSTHGSLRLKLGEFGHDKMLRFYLFVGDVRQGPFECNFAERTVQEFQLGVDWRKHVDRKADSLRLRLEVLSQ